MQNGFLAKHPIVKDALSIAIFILLVLVGTVLINNFIFRSFRVVGPSMEATLYTDQRLIVDRLSVTIANIQNKEYLPERGKVIVFKNPNHNPQYQDEYIVKRVIGLPGERVVAKDGKLTVYNKEFPNGHSYDEDFNKKYDAKIGSPSSGDIDTTVPAGQLFVAGDHRQGNFSFDSRAGMGTVPLYDVVGAVSLRFWPFDKIKSF